LLLGSRRQEDSAHAAFYRASPERLSAEVRLNRLKDLGLKPNTKRFDMTACQSRSSERQV
jgi:hypothetical protein